MREEQRTRDDGLGAPGPGDCQPLLRRLAPQPAPADLHLAVACANKTCMGFYENLSKELNAIDGGRRSSAPIEKAGAGSGSGFVFRGLPI